MTNKHPGTHPCFGIVTHERQTQITEGIKESHSKKPVGRLWKCIIWIVTAVQHIISPRNTCVSHYNTRSFQNHQYYFIFIVVIFNFLFQSKLFWIFCIRIHHNSSCITCNSCYFFSFSLTGHPQFLLSCLFLCRDYTQMNILNEKLRINGCV